MNKNYTIITCGTAGHVLPALTIVKELLKNLYIVNLIIDNNTYEKYKNILNTTEYINLNIILTIPFYLSWKFIYVIIKNIFITYKIIKKSSIIICFVAGLQIPTLITCILFNRNFILHEQDAVLNQTNNIFGIFAKNIFTSFKNCNIKYFSKYIIKKFIWTGCPLQVKDNIKNENITGKKIITIFAGTNGSNIMDKILIKELVKIPNINNYYIYHNCRQENIEYVKNFYQENNIESSVEKYFNNFEFLYKYSDFLITRGGASTISYLNHFKKNAILIPWSKSSQNHQYFNCLHISNINGAYMLNENELNNITYLINNLIHQKENLSINICKVFKNIQPNEYIELINKHI